MSTIRVARIGCVLGGRNKVISAHIFRSGPAGVCGLPPSATAAVDRGLAAHALGSAHRPFSPQRSVSLPTICTLVRLIKPQLLFAVVLLPDSCRTEVCAHTYTRPSRSGPEHAAELHSYGGHGDALITPSCTLHPSLQEECRSSRTTESGPMALETSCLTGLGMDRTQTLRRYHSVQTAASKV